MRIAVLGTGTIGAPISRNLLAAGHDVRVWNRTREKAEQVGAAVADTPADAVAGAGVVLTVLADGEAVRQTIEQALAEIPDDAIWIQLSTVGIEATERLAALAAERGVAFVDAPVLGTKEPAEKGELLVLASGPAQALERCRPVFEAIGRRTLVLGEAGAGTRLKLVVNAWLVALVESLAETLALAEALEVGGGRFLETIAGGSLDLPYAQLKGKAMVTREFPPSFALALALKDARLVLEAASRSGLELPVVRAVAEQFERAVEAGHGDEDMAAVWYASAPSREPAAARRS